MDNLGERLARLENAGRYVDLFERAADRRWHNGSRRCEMDSL